MSYTSCVRYYITHPNTHRIDRVPYVYVESALCECPAVEARIGAAAASCVRPIVSGCFWPIRRVVPEKGFPHRFLSVQQQRRQHARHATHEVMPSTIGLFVRVRAWQFACVDSKTSIACTHAYLIWGAPIDKCHRPSDRPPATC